MPRGTAGTVLDEDLVDRYLDTVAGLAGDGPRDLDIVYTPLHGVGGTSVVQVLETAGFARAAGGRAAGAARPRLPDRRVPEPGGARRDGPRARAGRRSTAPTSSSPTTRTPTGAPPPCPARTAGGCCAATRSARCWPRTCCARGKQGTYATSIVSSSLLGKMAAAAGQPYAETLTGFKWIGRVDGLAFGYEEALGYCVDPEHVRDKDGVSALLLLCELAAEAKAAGRTSTDLLDDIAAEHGLHATDQVSVRVTDLAEIAAAMDRLRATPPRVARRPRGRAASTTWRRASADLPPTDGLRYQLADGGRVIVRPSGTEPKLKCYLEVVVPVHPDDGVDAARISAAGRLDALRGDIKAAAGI